MATGRRESSVVRWGSITGSSGEVGGTGLCPLVSKFLDSSRSLVRLEPVHDGVGCTRWDCSPGSARLSSNAPQPRPVPSLWGRRLLLQALLGLLLWDSVPRPSPGPFLTLALVHGSPASLPSSLLEQVCYCLLASMYFTLKWSNCLLLHLLCLAMGARGEHVRRTSISLRQRMRRKPQREWIWSHHFSSRCWELGLGKPGCCCSYSPPHTSPPLGQHLTLLKKIDHTYTYYNNPNQKYWIPRKPP